jgi:hypothetical protein
MDFTDEEDDYKSASSSGSDSGIAGPGKGKYSSAVPSKCSVQTKFRRRDIDPAFRLTPGSHLQACNGSDIHLARGAIAPSSNFPVMPPPKHGKAAKTKHRYLIVWPGVLSLNPHRAELQKNNGSDEISKKEDPEDAEEATANVDKEDKAAEEAAEDEDMNDDDMNDNDNDKNGQEETNDTANEEENDKKTSATSTSVVASSSGSAATCLGTLEGLDTDKPTLKIPFPNGQSMTFAGRKVESSSKFMLLTCSKKGSVTCKVSFAFFLYSAVVSIF